MKKTYEFENLGCAHCAGKMEEKIGKLPDVESVNLSFPMKKMYVPFYQDNKLAETLSRLQIGDTIPPELYEVVAEILVFVDDMDRMKGKLKESGLL